MSPPLGDGPARTDVELNSTPEADGADSSSAADTLRADAAKAVHDLPFRAELRRKALHLLALVIPAGMVLLGRPLSLALLLPVTAVALTGDVLRVKSKRVASWIYRLFGFMMRPEECPPLGGRPTVNGASWVLISASLVLILFPVPLAAASFAAFMVADAAAAVVGRRFGRRRWGASPRTVEGSAAFFVVGTLFMLPLPHVPPAAAVIAALAGSAAEIPRGPLNDNVRVPLVMAIVLALLGV